MLPVSFVTCSGRVVSVTFSFFFSFFLLLDPVGGVLPLLERLFGVKGHDCFLSRLAFG